MLLDSLEGSNCRESNPQTLKPLRMLRSQGTGLLVIPRIAKSTIGGRVFSYHAPHLWNELPAHVWSADTITSFKARLKTSF